MKHLRYWNAAAATFFLFATSCGNKNPSFNADGDGGGTNSEAATTADSGGPIGTKTPQCPGQETTITGKALAPNGQDPVSGATIYIPASLPELYSPEVKCEVCRSLGSSDVIYQATSGDDGTFTLKDVCPGTRFLVMQNGRFRRVIQLTIPAKNNMTLSAQQTRFPRKKGELHYADSAPKVAVATGDYDKMECELRRMGLDDSQIDFYEGASMLMSPKMLPNFTELVEDLSKMKTYNIIFINCTHNTWEKALSQKSVRDNMMAYVQSGGRLYVTDWSYDWIEQIPELAPYLDYEPDNSAAQPETANAAALGEYGLKVKATVKDPKLAGWLKNFPGAIKDGITPIEHFLAEWVMLRTYNQKDVKLWVEGPVSSRDGSIKDKVHPLTVTFNFKNCGKVLFTSYHTAGRDDELPQSPLDEPSPKQYPDYCGGQASPQERILEYLIFDIANCVRLIDE